MPRKTKLDAMADAAPIEAPDLRDIEDAPEDQGPLLPLPCPVTPLGVRGSKLEFLDRLNQLQETSTECRKNDMTLWFGDGYLIKYFPQFKKPRSKDDEPELDGFNQKTASAALVEECTRRGIFSPEGRVFGRGAHRAKGDEEMMVLHLGTRLLLANARDHQGRRSRDIKPHPAGALHVPDVGTTYYPARPGLPAPAEQASLPVDAEDLLQLLDTWFWIEDGASLLLLGYIGQMFICGALGWRSHMWLTGPTGTGKTSLQNLIRAIHADWCLHTEDASEAAIRQTLGDDTLPVMIDEAEAHDNPERVQNILNLMKKGSSGGKMHRGSADHKAQEFVVRSCFLLSSVLVASMRGEDRNRIAILEMHEIPEGATPPAIDLIAWRKLGRRFHRRMIDQWPRYAKTLAIYKRAIANQRFSGRFQDTYGNLLACADLMRWDNAPDDMVPDGQPGMQRVYDAVQLVLPMMRRGSSESRSDVERCVQFLMSRTLPGAHGKPPEPIGTWLERAMSLRLQVDDMGNQIETMDGDARARLKAVGLRVIEAEQDSVNGKGIFKGDARTGDEAWRTSYLGVAYGSCQPLAELFRGTEWSDGKWLQSLGKIPGVLKGLKLRYAGRNPDNAIGVPLTAFEGAEG